MNPPPRVRIQTADFDLSAEVAALRAGDGGVGAVTSFVGTVRDRNASRTGQPGAGAESVSAMELEHYPGMTERAIEAMIDEAFQRFDLRGARVIHRVGLLQPLDQIVLVVVSSAHRGESFKGCEFLMDYLKTHAPFWKKETTPDGARWVDARVADDLALARWGLAGQNSSTSPAPLTFGAPAASSVPAAPTGGSASGASSDPTGGPTRGTAAG
jgi:molybdopterin synthase catalytic subunit